jgi:hypothetical protein
MLLMDVIHRLDATENPEKVVVGWEQRFPDFSDSFFAEIGKGPTAILGKKKIPVLTENAAAALNGLWPPAPVFASAPSASSFAKASESES